MTSPCSVVWFRRDLRLQDHAALSAALRDDAPVQAVFVFDRPLLDDLPDRCDRRIEFILACLTELDAGLRKQGGRLHVLIGDARTEIPALAARLDARTVYANRDYEPIAIARDAQVAEALHSDGRSLQLSKDQVIFDTDEVLTKTGKPYAVFGPYRRAWLAALTPAAIRAHPVDLHGRLAQPGAATSKATSAETRHAGLPTLAQLGFEATDLQTMGVPVGMSGARALFEEFQTRIDAYHERRDYPAVVGPSRLSVHLRFGTISIRELVAYAHALAEHDRDAATGAQTWLTELIWREFYQQMLFHAPQLVDHCFRPEFDALQWEKGDEAERRFEAWCRGLTGYPIIDAAQRQLVSTGYQHNRLRMLSASFLTKDLGIDWRLGERFYARWLLDYDLASNNGGWQWAASTGSDAQPWFRIFNPVTQSRRFDPQARFIAGYVPELERLAPADRHAPWETPQQRLSDAKLTLGKDYPLPIVDHAAARDKTLSRFGAARQR